MHTFDVQFLEIQLHLVQNYHFTKLIFLSRENYQKVFIFPNSLLLLQKCFLRFQENNSFAGPSGQHVNHCKLAHF